VVMMSLAARCKRRSKKFLSDCGECAGTGPRRESISAFCAVTSVGVASRSRCHGVTSEVVTMSLAARRSAAAESLVEARPAEFGVGDDRTVEVRLAEVRLLVHFATMSA